MVFQVMQGSGRKAKMRRRTLADRLLDLVMQQFRRGLPRRIG